MNRRQFVTTGGAAMAMQANAAETKGPSILVLRQYKLRNNPDAMGRRLQEYLQKSHIPAARRAGAGPFGVFSSVVAADSPFILTLSSVPGFAALEDVRAKMAADAELRKAQEAYYTGPLQFVRYETTLLRGFSTFPRIEVPKPAAGGSRVYEVRIYESNNPVTLARKIRMFDEGEIDLFKKVGMTTVFFGETVAGQNMPNLTYMIGFDSMGARDQVWSKFGTSEEWKKMLQQPGVSDAEIVSNITNYIVRPLSFSEIL
jgi:hypothetical protein